MTVTIPYRCDGPNCAAQKTPSNKWWLLWQAGGILYLAPWRHELAGMEGVKHLCGLQCVSRMADLFMVEMLRTEIAHGNSSQVPHPAADAPPGGAPAATTERP